MPKDESPQITVNAPITTECPFNEEPSRCIEAETRNWVDQNLGAVKDENITILFDNIKIEVRYPSGFIEKTEFPTTHWPCVQDALDYIRLRLNDDFITKFTQLREDTISDIEQQIRASCPEPKIRTIIEERIIEIPVPSEEELGDEGFGSIMGLETGKRTERDLATLAGIRLNRWSDDSFKTLARAARSALK